MTIAKDEGAAVIDGDGDWGVDGEGLGGSEAARVPERDGDILYNGVDVGDTVVLSDIVGMGVDKENDVPEGEADIVGFIGQESLMNSVKNSSIRKTRASLSISASAFLPLLRSGLIISTRYVIREDRSTIAVVKPRGRSLT